MISFETCINFLVSCAQSSVQQAFRRKLNAFDLTPGQYMILCCLWESSEPLSPTQISQAVHLDTSTITGVLDRLTYKNLLERVPSPADRRTLLINLTDAGRLLQTDVSRVINEANEEVLKDFTDSERELLLSYLVRLAC
jgi:DNA-binding MarR family transcriptional regulator